MSVRSLRRNVAACVVALFGAASLTTLAPNPTVAAGPITIAVPAYFDDDALWEKMLNTPAVQYVIAHPAPPVDGKPYTADKELLARLNQAKAKGKIPLVYVTAGYDKVDWKVVADRIDTVLEAYPPAAGVFIDEINYNQCDKYNSLTKGAGSVKGVRARQPGKLIVLNPGAPMLKCYEGLADGYLNLERADKDIPAWVANVKEPGNVPEYQWMFSESNRPKIWTAIHSVNPVNAAAAVDQAIARNASVLYITDDVMPNPYDSLPSEAAWKAVLDRVNQYQSGQIPLPAVIQIASPTVPTTAKSVVAPTPTPSPKATTKKRTVPKRTTKKKTR